MSEGAELVRAGLTDEQVLKLFEVEDFVEALDLDATMHGYSYPAEDLEWIRDRLTRLVIGG